VRTRQRRFTAPLAAGDFRKSILALLFAPFQFSAGTLRIRLPLSSAAAGFGAVDQNTQNEMNTVATSKL
jgi:hypothetical protein